MILITNDDGYDSEYHTILYQILKKNNYDVISIVPNRDYSGVGGKTTNPNYYKIKPYEYGFVLNGTPVDCIKYGLKHYKPNLIITGINKGLNCEEQIYKYSATFNSALYGSKQGIKSLSVSIDNKNLPHNDIIEKIITKTLSYNFQLANLNIINKDLILTKINHYGCNDTDTSHNDIATDYDVIFNQGKSSLTIIK